MGTLKYLFVGCLCALSSSGFAQANSENQAIQGFATFVPGRLFESGERTFALHGELEYVINPKVSLLGDGFYQLQNSHEPSARYAFNHNLFSGLVYHPYQTSGEFQFDTYVGIQPGIAISKLNSTTNGTASSSSIDPVVAWVMGGRVQLTPHLYVFGQFRLIHGNRVETEFHRLDEIRFSTGLGFTFWYRRDRK